MDYRSVFVSTTQVWYYFREADFRISDIFFPRRKFPGYSLINICQNTK